MPRGAQDRHRQLTQEVVEDLRQRILEGEVAPGEWLRQERLAREHGVSQMPIRDAFKQLAAEGLVEHLPYRGVRVVEFSRDDVEDLYLCRAFVEGRAARFAAVNISDGELAELRAIQAGIKEAVGPERVAEYRELNRRFHALIIAASRRSLLSRSLAGMWAAFPNMLWNTFLQTAREFVVDRVPADEDEHDAILSALEAHDPDGAEKAMRRHVMASGESLMRMLETRP
jgi:DNA-binding GntR family transcriptional regulator